MIDNNRIFEVANIRNEQIQTACEDYESGVNQILQSMPDGRKNSLFQKKQDVTMDMVVNHAKQLSKQQQYNARELALESWSRCLELTTDEKSKLKHFMEQKKDIQ